MKTFLTIGFILFFSGNLLAQTIIKMEKMNGVFVMPCKVNGLSLKFILDTGASDVTISLTEALFMLKNGYLSESDLIGTEYYKLANGDIQEGTKITLKTIEIQDLKLYNVKASIVHNMNAPLLLGQTALSKLGKMEFDFAKNTLTIYSGTTAKVIHNTERSENISPMDPYYRRDDVYHGNYLFKTTFDNPPYEPQLRKELDINSKIIYTCPKDATVFVIAIDQASCKVYVNGNIGFLSKGILKRQK